MTQLHAPQYGVAGAMATGVAVGQLSVYALPFPGNARAIVAGAFLFFR